jgi:hypothetical protein
MALLQRHIGSVIPAVGLASLDEFSRYVLSGRMADEHVFAELCHASSAVPRRLHQRLPPGHHPAASRRRRHHDHRQRPLGHV